MSSSNSTTNTNIINPKSCSYGCNTRIYWNVSENAYFEVFSRKKHSCPNSFNSKSTTTNATKPNYYNKKSFNSTNKEPKPKISNSLELVTGSIADIQKKYEILSDIVSEARQGSWFSEMEIQRLVY